VKKSIPTAQTPANIAKVLELLSAIPGRLAHLSAPLPEAPRHAPLGPGDRTVHGVLVHLVNCEAIAAENITLALLLNEPLVPPLHPERSLGPLLRFDRVAFNELLPYFTTRRTILMNVLNKLENAKWARCVRAEGKLRVESVYWQARGLALHEDKHLTWLEERLPVP